MRLLLALVIGVAGVTLLLRLADLSQINLRAISLKLALLPCVFLGLMVVLRGELLRRIAPPKPDVPRLRWLRLVSHHQLLFMLAPSGLGDAGFFALAKHHVGLDSAEATATLALYRLRDAIVLVSLGIAGGLMMADLTALAAVVAALAVLALLFLEETAALGLQLVRRFLPAGRVTNFLERAATAHASASGGRMAKALVAAAIWASSALATASAFAAAGHPLSLQQTILMLAALNASGAIAISIGGIGVAEAGAAGMLMLFGETAAAAAAVSLVARPLLFLSAVAASAALDLVSWWRLRRRPSARR